MDTIVTVIAALVIASPFVVLALRTTRWDPFARRSAGAVAADERDADARRTAADVAALVGHDAPTATRPLAEPTWTARAVHMDRAA
ncbi:hypothetical protein [Cellulomonas sp. HZM]|uniref:hypothetical protein n=1 Tax=Cellulomonas sp. HZM TaxID=1454010 RepID=UPI00049301F3|nr:hypothetical protein [Cellulomonas sp. HZM]